MGGEGALWAERSKEYADQIKNQNRAVNWAFHYRESRSISLVQLRLLQGSQKSENFVLGFFICAAGTTSFARKGNIISNEARTSLPLAAQMNDVEALPQMMWAYAQ